MSEAAKKGKRATGRYARIYDRLYSDSERHVLGPHALLLWPVILSAAEGRVGGCAGVYRLTVEEVCIRSLWPRDVVLEGLRRLQAQGWIEYDADEQWVAVPGLVAYNRTRSPLLLKGMASFFDAAPTLLIIERQRARWNGQEEIPLGIPLSEQNSGKRLALSVKQQNADTVSVRVSIPVPIPVSEKRVAHGALSPIQQRIADLLQPVETRGISENRRSPNWRAIQKHIVIDEARVLAWAERMRDQLTAKNEKKHTLAYLRAILDQEKGLPDERRERLPLIR